MRMAVTQHKNHETHSDYVKIDESWQDSVEKALKKKSRKKGRPDHDVENVLPDPKSMEAESD